VNSKVPLDGVLDLRVEDPVSGHSPCCISQTFVIVYSSTMWVAKNLLNPLI
jgi:hypothetical protein